MCLDSSGCSQDWNQVMSETRVYRDQDDGRPKTEMMKHAQNQTTVWSLKIQSLLKVKFYLGVPQFRKNIQTNMPSEKQSIVWIPPSLS